MYDMKESPCNSRSFGFVKSELKSNFFSAGVAKKDSNKVFRGGVDVDARIDSAGELVRILGVFHLDNQIVHGESVKWRVICGFQKDKATPALDDHVSSDLRRRSIVYSRSETQLPSAGY
jgi:hypothetical protein